MLCNAFPGERPSGAGMHYVIADPHGEYGRFLRMLTEIAFSAEDTLYILGDVVDRGGVGGVDILLDVMERPNVVMLRGNHEEMCLKAVGHPDDQRAVNHWRRNGGQVTWEALSRLDGEERRRVLDFLRALPDHLDLEAGEATLTWTVDAGMQTSLSAACPVSGWRTWRSSIHESVIIFGNQCLNFICKEIKRYVRTFQMA